MSKGQNRTGTEDEKHTDDGRSDLNGATDGACRRTGFPGKNGDIFEAGQSTDHHEADGGEGVAIEDGQDDRQRFPVDGLATQDGKDGQQDEYGEDDCDGTAAEVVEPFAKVEAINSREGKQDKDTENDGAASQWIFGEMGAGGSEQIADLRKHGKEDDRSDAKRVDPDVPGDEESREVAEGDARPGVEAAFEWHLAVEVEDGSGHGQVKDGHCRDPVDSLRAAEQSCETDPSGADDEENLSKDEIEKRERTLESVCVSRGCGTGWLRQARHG